jgi:hypothetical protein
MKTVLFCIWKIFYMRSDDAVVEWGCPGEHPTVGSYAMLCRLEQGAGGRGGH